MTTAPATEELRGDANVDDETEDSTPAELMGVPEASKCKPIDFLEYASQQ